MLSYSSIHDKKFIRKNLTQSKSGKIRKIFKIYCLADQINDSNKKQNHFDVPLY